MKRIDLERIRKGELFIVTLPNSQKVICSKLGYYVLMNTIIETVHYEYMSALLNEEL